MKVREMPSGRGQPVRRLDEAFRAATAAFEAFYEAWLGPDHIHDWRRGLTRLEPPARP